MLHLPELVCPYCLSTSAPVPVPAEDAHGIDDLQACGVCREKFVELAGGTKGIPVPDNFDVKSSGDRFELALRGWFITFGAADTALRIRIEPDHIAWSEYPLLGTIRFSETWTTAPRAPVSRFDWRMRESGLRGTRGHEEWNELTLVAHDGSELPLRHHFPLIFRGTTAITTLLEWAHADAVRHGPEINSAYRAPQRRLARPPLALIRPNGTIHWLAT